MLLFWTDVGVSTLSVFSVQTRLVKLDLDTLSTVPDRRHSVGTALAGARNPQSKKWCPECVGTPESRELKRRTMAKKLYVGNLSWSTTDDGLLQAFEVFGPVQEAKVITDRDTGRSRGFGFVTFGDDDAATTAVEEMDGKPLDGRNIKVNEARERAPRNDGGGGGGRGRW